MKFAEEPEEVKIEVYQDEHVDVDYLNDKFNGFNNSSSNINIQTENISNE